MLGIGFFVMLLSLSFLVYVTIQGNERQNGKGKLSAIVSTQPFIVPKQQHLSSKTNRSNFLLLFWQKKILLNFLQMVALAASMPLQWVRLFFFIKYFVNTLFCGCLYFLLLVF